MKNLVAVLFVLLSLNAFSQIPDYVPTDGLVGWYPFNGNANDESGVSEDGEIFSLEAAEDRFGNANSAFYFSSSGCTPHIETNIDFQGSSEGMTISYWLNRQGSGCMYPRLFGFWSGGNNPQSWGMAWGNSAVLDYMGESPANNQWHHVLVTLDADSIHAYLNGELKGAYASTKQPPLASYMSIGRMTHPAYDAFNGYMDDFGIWNRILLPEEIESMYESDENQSIEGCTDLGACNFNPDAIVDDGSCFEAPFIAVSGADVDSVSTCSGESISLSAMGTTSALDSTLLDAFTMTVNSYYSRTTPVLESGHTYRLIGNGRYGVADGWSHNDPAWNYVWDQETGSKVYCNGTQDASEDVSWLYDGAANFQRPDNDYHNNDNNAFCNGSDKTYAWTIEGDGNAHVISWEDCCYGDNSGSLDFWLYELTGVPGGPETTWSTGDQGATTELTPSESQWVTLTTMLDGNSLCQDSIWIEVVTSGCNDENACNYSMLAVCSVDCIYPLVGEDCEAGAVACAEGTVWDDESQTCIVANPSDSNFDGCVQLNDLLDLLSAYGTCAWQCGDPVSYEDYDYETVQIGEQCWFAENARYLPSVSSPDVGSEDDGQPHAYVYGYSGTDISEATGTASYLTYGSLYNFVAIVQWQLCPIGWSVPSEQDWVSTLEAPLWNGAELRSLTWNGTNQSGFNALPGGFRDAGGFFNESSGADYWTSTEFDSSFAERRFLLTTSDALKGSNDPRWKSHAFSVRCVKDAE